MPRPLRIEYPGARYHVICRGDRREDIFWDSSDREKFLHLLGRACAKTGAIVGEVNGGTRVGFIGVYALKLCP